MSEESESEKESEKKSERKSKMDSQVVDSVGLLQISEVSCHVLKGHDCRRALRFAPWQPPWAALVANSARFASRMESSPKLYHL